MALHRLTHVTVGVPDVAADGGVLRGVRPDADRRRALRHRRRRRAAPARRRADAAPRSSSASAPTTPTTWRASRPRLRRLGVAVERRPTTPSPPSTPARACASSCSVAPRIQPAPRAGPRRATAPAVSTAATRRADAILREAPVRPRKLGHVVLGSTDLEASAAVLHRGRRLQGERHGRRARVASCAARPTTTTCSCSPRRCRCCTTPRGRSTTSTRSAAAPRDARRAIRAGTCGASAAITSARTSSGT